MITARFLANHLVLTAFGLACILAAEPSSAEVYTPCSETISKFCKDVVPGGGRIMKCLNDHRDDQSIACKDWVDGQMKSLNELMAACPEEIATFCGSDPPDKTRIYFCLLNNYVSLRLECRSKLGEIRDRLK
jgi:hypothetical protein